MGVIKRIRIYAALVARVFGEFAFRLHEGGWGRARVYLACFTNDFHVKLRNRWTSAARAECPCCGWTGYDFVPLDGKGFWLKRSACPSCAASERHRFLHLYLPRCEGSVLERTATVLHYAPEPSVRRILETRPALRCFASDLDLERLRDAKGRSFQSDISRIPIQDEGVDIVFCLHVLEHLPNDVAAIAELYRILKPGGVAYLMVPVDLGARETVFFGRPNPDACDHYWSHALDFGEKLRQFDYQLVTPRDILSPEEAYRYAVPDQELIWRCVKR